MSDSTYNLVFEGKTVADQDLAEVKKRLQKVFNKDAATIEKLFSGRKVKLKQGLKKEQADQYKAKMLSIGVICEVESATPKAAVPPKPVTSTAEPVASATAAASRSPETAAVGSPVVANVTPPPPENKGKPIKLADIDKACIGMVPRVDLPVTYKVGVVAMGVTMVLLPLLYIGLIALVGYGVISHSIVNTSWFETLGSKFGFIAYVTPIVAGVTVISFMLKPLFAPPAVKSKTVVLDSVKEPVLFHFVNKIAVAVGAPRPKQIEVDCEVNASARFRKGLFSFMGDDLVLTLGMPLLAGFNTKQLAGVLAHEFGHFSQGVGMRFHYLAYKINSWLFYSVHARDRWDQQLDKLAERSESWASVILNFARGGVWLTRKILTVFMVTGQLVSSYMLRQMEFDADRYEAHVAGSEQFKDTTMRLQRLGAAFQVSHDYLEQAWEDKKLVNDFPALVAHNATKLPEQLDQALLAQMEEARTQLYDSHPSDRERIENAAAQQAKGIVVLDRHSRELFKRFDSLSKEVSELYYAHELGLDFDASKLVDIGQVVKIAHDNEKQQEAYRKYFKDMAPVFDLPLSVNIFDTSKTNWDDLLAQYREVNNKLADQISDRRMLMKKADECFTRYQHFSTIIDLEEAKFILFPEWFDITPEVLEAGKKQKAMYEQAWQQTMQQLGSMFAINDQRLSIALTLLNHPKAIDTNPEHAHHLKTRNHLSLLVNNIKRNAPAIVEFRNRHARLLAFLSCAHAINNQKQADVASVRDQLLGELKESAQQLTASLSRLDYPYVAEGEHQTIADYLETMLPRANQFSHEYEFYLASGNIILEKLEAIYGRVISGLANVALTVDIMVPYIEGRAPKPELDTQPVIEQEEYVPAEVSEEEMRELEMAQAVGAENFANRMKQPEPEEVKPKEPVKINVREIKNPGTRSVFAIDESVDEPVEEKTEEKVAKDTVSVTATDKSVTDDVSDDKVESKPVSTTVSPAAVESAPAGNVTTLNLEKPKTSEPKPVAPAVVGEKASEEQAKDVVAKPAALSLEPVEPDTKESDASESLTLQASETESQEEPVATARSNVDSGVPASFAIDSSKPEDSSIQPVSASQPSEEKSEQLVEEEKQEENKVVARENKDAGVTASFAIDESAPEVQETKSAEPQVDATEQSEGTDEKETVIEARENNDAGMTASFAIDESEPEPVADKLKEATAKLEVVARENNDAGKPASFSIDETAPEKEEQAQSVEPEKTQPEPKAANPFLPQSSKSSQEKALPSEPPSEPALPAAKEEQPVSVVAKTPNPFLANISTYKAKLEKEQAEASAAAEGSNVKEGASISMDALNAGSTPALATQAKEDKPADNDQPASLSTGGLSLEPMSEDQNSEDSGQASIASTASDPQSVVVEKPDVQNALDKTRESDQQESGKFFESPGLPNSCPTTQERGLRPEPPTDIFNSFGSDVSLEKDDTDSESKPDQEQA